jgi:hypothetical protein
MKLHLRFGLIAALFLTVFALYPQFKLLYLRGDDWQGSYAMNDIDEVAYAAYLQALIDGRPRKNDPYTHRDDSAETPQEESLFSIQFATPYAVAIPARLLGLSGSTAMFAAGAFAAFFAALACFWLVGRLTDDSWLAMTATLIVLCCGALAAGEGALNEILYDGTSYPYFPFLRRYIPAVPFSIIFAFIASVWQVLNASEIKTKTFWSIASVFSFAFLTFSYFYLWTTAFAWFLCFGFIYMLFNFKELLSITTTKIYGTTTMLSDTTTVLSDTTKKILDTTTMRKNMTMLCGILVGCLITLGYYAYLLSHRSHTMDDVQLLVLTRELDLMRVPELISYASLVMLVLGVLIKTLQLKHLSTIFAFSFAFVPIIVFNQQLITGRSLQPIHYQVFIGNYVALLGLVVTLGLLWKKINVSNKVSNVVFSILSIAAISWGFVECHYTVRVLDEANVLRDKGMDIANKLKTLDKNGVTLPFSLLQGDDLPTIAPQSVLWARHQHVFAGVTWQENKERYYQTLYYQNMDEKQLAENMKNGDFVSVIALFGWGRHTDRLNSEYKPLTYREIDEEAAKYGEYKRNFSLVNAANPTISYVTIPNDWQLDLSNLDFWYDRDNGEVFDEYTLYKVKLKK